MDQLAQPSMPLVCNAGQGSLEAPHHSATEAHQVQCLSLLSCTTDQRFVQHSDICQVF